jgi:hypothetical protein
MPSTAEIAPVLDEGRREFRGMCTDVLRITRNGAGGRGAFNETTGQYDAAPARVVVYEGPGRVQVKADINSNVVETTAGDREFTYLTDQLQLPAEFPPYTDWYDGTVVGSPFEVDVDNVVEILAAPYAPSMVGSKLNVAGPYNKSQAVYLRFRVREPVG